MINLDNRNKKGFAIPVSDMVLLPGMVYTLKLTKISEKEFQNLAWRINLVLHCL
jgi:ATP-dependent Lon protease